MTREQLGLFDAKPKRRKKAPLVAACEEARAVADYPVEQALAELDPAVDAARSALLGVLAGRPDLEAPTYQPRAVAFAHAIGRFPDDVWSGLGAFQGPCRNIRFVHWVGKQWDAWAEERGRPDVKERWSKAVMLDQKDHDDFDAWLARRYPEPAALSQSDTRNTLAAYSRQVRNESGIGSPDLWCGVHVELDCHHGTKPPGFLLDGHIELPDRETRWRFCRVYKTRDEAAAWAAAFVAEAERLLGRWAAGERGIVTPGARQWAAAMAHVRDLPEYIEAAAGLEARASSEDPDAWRAATRERHEAKEATSRLEQEEGRRFCDAHPWTDFVEERR